MKCLGIWLDKRKAIIVTLENGQEHLKKINSEVDEGNTRGGARSSTPYGPQDVVREKALLEKRKQQMKKYFSSLIKQLKNVEQLLILGPADTKTALLKEIQSHQEFETVKIHMKNADSMTLPQIKSHVRDHFRTLINASHK